MSVRLSLSFRSQRFSTPFDRSCDPLCVSSNSSFLCFVPSSSPSRLSLVWSRSIDAIGSSIAVPKALNQDRTLQELDDSPASVQLMPIISGAQFDQVIAEAQQLEQPVIIVWMASWCRKCVYLKPKLEKLAADYYPRMRLYSIDVNKVPHKLVARAGVTKMPTIQLWKDSKKKAEVVGGHKSYLVVNEVCQMIENECDL